MRTAVVHLALLEHPVAAVDGLGNARFRKVGDGRAGGGAVAAIGVAVVTRLPQATLKALGHALSRLGDRPPIPEQDQCAFEKHLPYCP